MYQVTPLMDDFDKDVLNRFPTILTGLLQRLAGRVDIDPDSFDRQEMIDNILSATADLLRAKCVAIVEYRIMQKPDAVPDDLNDGDYFSLENYQIYLDTHLKSDEGFRDGNVLLRQYTGYYNHPSFAPYVVTPQDTALVPVKLSQVGGPHWFVMKKNSPLVLCNNDRIKRCFLKDDIVDYDGSPEKEAELDQLMQDFWEYTQSEFKGEQKIVKERGLTIEGTQFADIHRWYSNLYFPVVSKDYTLAIVSINDMELWKCQHPPHIQTIRMLQTVVNMLIPYIGFSHIVVKDRKNQDLIIKSAKMSALGDMTVAYAHGFRNGLYGYGKLGLISSLSRKTTTAWEVMADLNVSMRERYERWLDYVIQVGNEQGEIDEDIQRDLVKTLKQTHSGFSTNMAKVLVSLRLFGEQDLIQEFVNDFPGKNIEAILDQLSAQFKINAIVSGCQGTTLELESMVEIAKSYAGGGSSEKTDLDVNKCLQTTLKILRYELDRKGVKLKLDLQEGLPNTYGCAAEINQVLSNIITNGILALDGIENPLIEICSRVKEGKPEIEIRNNGPQIAADITDRIYEPDVSTRKGKGGLGRGLSICRQIMTDHGGYVSHASSETNTSFYLRFNGNA